MRRQQQRKEKKRLGHWRLPVILLGSWDTTSAGGYAVQRVLKLMISYPSTQSAFIIPSLHRPSLEGGLPVG
jgi:hypothetical protein